MNSAAEAETGPRPSFHSIHRHGFVRVGVATPPVFVADPARNAEAAIAQAVDADARKVDLLVFPELNLSAYAIDDLHLQDAVLDGVEAAIVAVCEASRSLAPVILVGAPLRRNGRLYNCAVAISRGRILGVVPKLFLPNYREYYEKRWFASGAGMTGLEIEVAGQLAPFGIDLLFEASDLAGFVFHIEICEDYWAPTPPSTDGALAGALILCNLSASNIVVGKAADRHLLSASQSMRCSAAYVYSAAGRGESTTDLAWDGQGTIYELGDLVAESERFAPGGQMIVGDVDVGRIQQERLRTPTFNDAAALRDHPEKRFRRVRFEHRPTVDDIGFERGIRRFPYVPNTPERLDQDCFEAFNIQVDGLRRRFDATPGDHMVIGVSGGLEFDPRADRRGQGLRPDGPASLDHPWLHPSRLRHRRCHQGERARADARPRRRLRGDRHPPRRPADARRHGPSVRGGRTGLRRHLRERAGGPEDRLPVPPGEPAPGLRRRHRRPLRTGARLVHLRRRRPDEPLRRQRRRPEDADPVPDPLDRAHRDSSTRRRARC